MSNIAIIVTGADLIPDITKEKRIERHVEYMLSLYKIFDYKLPTYGVISEYDPINMFRYIPFDKFKFNQLVLLKSLPPHFGKSQKECFSILNLLKNLDFSDDTFVVKVTGRYLILNDTFMNIVKTATTNYKIDAIIKRVETSDSTMISCGFLFALRWKYFKDFYMNSMDLLKARSVELVLYEYLEQNDLLKNTQFVDNLDILTNINSEGIFRIY